MSHKTKPKPVYYDMRPILDAFKPLLMQQITDAHVEADTNKAFHTGTKEYEFVATVTGHEPINHIQ